MMRTIVQDGKKTKDRQAPSGAITPTTQKVDNELSEKLQTVEEERRITASDFEKGSRESEDTSGFHCTCPRLHPTPLSPRTSFSVPPISPRPHCVPKIYFSIVYAVLISNVYPDPEPYRNDCQYMLFSTG